MNITYERAALEDIDDYIRIARQVVSRFNCVATTVVDARKEIEESFVFMIRIDGKKVGFISYVLRQSDSAYISEVQVEPAFQGKGIGGAALYFILTELDFIKIFDLYTHPESRARKLYARVGFRETGEVSENHCNTGEPRIRMVLERQ